MSLKEDRAKKEEKQHKRRVQDARMSRLHPEPQNNYVTVKVKHPILGLVSRKFQANSLMSSVYDWAGYLNPDPLNSTLNDPLGFVLLPSREVIDRCTLKVMESLVGTPPLCISDDEISFLGFGQDLNSSGSSLFSELGDDHSGIQLQQGAL